MTMNELHSRLASLGPEDLVLDVRSGEEYREGHVARSRNIPYDQVAQFADELKNYRQVYIYCHIGGRAQIAAHLLANLGLENLTCIGNTGMKDWYAAGLPTEK